MADQPKESGFGSFASRMKEELKGYINARLELIRYQAAEQVAVTGGKIGSLLIQAWIFTVFFLILSVTIALMIGSKLNDYPMGFLIVSGFLLAITLLVILFRNRIQDGISQSIAAGLIPKESTEESSAKPPASSQS